MPSPYAERRSKRGYYLPTIATDDKVRFAIYCKVCDSEFLVQIDPSRPQLVSPPTAAAKHCIYCGAQSLSIMSQSERSLWRDIAVHHGMPDTELSEELVKALWEEWAPPPLSSSGTGPRFFSQFLDEALRENAE